MTSLNLMAKLMASPYVSEAYRRKVRTLAGSANPLPWAAVTLGAADR